MDEDDDDDLDWDIDDNDDPDGIPYDGISPRKRKERSSRSFLDRVGSDNAPWEKHFREDYKYHASICQHDDPYDCDDDDCY